MESSAKVGVKGQSKNRYLPLVATSGPPAHLILQGGSFPMLSRARGG